MMAAGLVLLPCAFLKNLHAVSSLSFWNGVVHTVINVVILGYCILHIGTWGWAKVSLGIDILSFPIALGVIVFSYTSQIFLPTLEGNMQDKSKFHCMLNWSHIAAAIFKAAFGYIGCKHGNNNLHSCPAGSTSNVCATATGAAAILCSERGIATRAGCIQGYSAKAGSSTCAFAGHGGPTSLDCPKAETGPGNHCQTDQTAIM